MGKGCDFASQVMSGDTVGGHSGGRVLLASVEKRPGRLLSILQCTGQPHNKEVSRPNVSNAQVESF